MENKIAGTVSSYEGVSTVQLTLIRGGQNHNFISKNACHKIVMISELAWTLAK